MKNLVLISSSPKINEDSVSKYITELASSHFDEANTNKTFIDVRQSISKHKTKEDFEAISKSDAIIIAFPLYVFCMPGILTRFLEDYYKYYNESGKINANPKVYVIVNCGFPEPEINLEAVRVIKSFSRHINATFRFGVQIGGGGMLLGAKDAPFMKKVISSLHNTFSDIAKDINSENLETIENKNISMNFPRRLYMFMGDKGWGSAAKKNGLKKKDLYMRPYC